jgi:hypothetical protein
MGKIHVDRVQYPVGQGGFHSMVLHVGNKRFSVVIDCGGDTQEHRQTFIDAFATGELKHDALVISHLDWDHIGGLGALARAGVQFANVFLPHVQKDVYARWMTIRLAHAIEDADISVIAEAVNYLGGLYGGRYGRPIQVVASDDLDGPPLVQDVPQVPDNGQYPAVSSLLDVDLQQMLTTPSASRGFPDGRSVTLQYLDWLLRFYSWEWACPDSVAAIWDEPVFQPLRDAVDNLMRSGFREDPALVDAVTDALENKILASNAKSVVAKFGKGSISGKKSVSIKVLLGKLYSAAPDLKNYNDASLSVYAGPSLRGADVRRTGFLRRVEAKGRRRYLHPDGADALVRAVGWMHTGDANLDHVKKKARFMQHYRIELPMTSVLVLPHHGSRHSYSSTLSEFDALIAEMAERPLFVAAAQPDGPYGHPHGAVVARCMGHGTLHIVDRRTGSMLEDSVHVPNECWWAC